MIHIDQEPERIPRGLIKWSALLVIISIAASIGATIVLAGHRSLGEMSEPPAAKQPANFDHFLFALPTELELQAREEREHLRRYGWADRTRGTVHVPIDVAIELYLAERAR